MRIKKLLFSRLTCALLTVIFTLCFASALNYFMLVPFNLRSAAFWGFIALLTPFAAGFGFACCFFRRKILKEDDEPYEFKERFLAYPIPFIVLFFAVVWLIVLFAISIPSWQMTNAKAYSNLITIQEGDFQEDIISVSSSDIVFVDVKTAQELGNRTIGNIANAPWYEDDNEYNLVSIDGEEYRISPLEYSGLFQALKAKSLPGYVIVNAKNQEAEYVEFKEPMLYSPDAYFEYDLMRHLRGQYPSYIFANKSFFEVDDEGNPFWITAVKTHTIGLFGGSLQNSAIVTNAVTGESIEYAISDLPGWIDHVHSVDYLMKLVDWHYKYANGFLNFSGTDKYRPSYAYKDSRNESSDNGQDNSHTPFDGYNSVLTNTGEIVFSTGITPANKSEAIIGFVLANPRTSTITFYEISGSEESSAMSAAEGLVQNLRYSASFPTIINVDGIETYFMTLKDGAGLIQKYALCNVSQYAIVVEADSIEEAIIKYRNRIGTADLEGSSSDNTETTEIFEASGVVTKVETAQIDGYTYYYFTLDSEDIVFMSSIQNSNKQPLMLIENAQISVKYRVSNDAEIGIVTEIVF